MALLSGLDYVHFSKDTGESWMGKSQQREL